MKCTALAEGLMTNTVWCISLTGQNFDESINQSVILMSKILTNVADIV